ncbi:MAG: peptidase M14 [Alphaproteobacteria bacterium]|nr:peptidase M14 [Alphaproteobacteria bacterium]MCB9698827.1 peptidase M14 [Alphaproteobacteria bacterium]
MFRSAYLDHDALTAQLRAWADAWPDLVRLSSIGTTPEGRDLWLLTLGRDPDRVRPSAWVDGNMHAAELAGSSVALGIAEDVIAVLRGENPRGLAPSELEVLREIRVFVLPRMSPDGAEAVLTTGRSVRSVPRDARPDALRPRWETADIDGDGLALSLRVRDPAGDFVEAPGFPGLMVPREPTDAGPFYKIWPEGRIVNDDGLSVPDPSYLSDNYPDLNRNFPFDWRGENEQAGAGPHPASEPESRAVVTFVEAHPELMAWLNLHTYGGVHIRPCGDRPDTRMDPSDLALFREIGAWAEELTGYPMVSGYEEFTYEPDKPLRGDMSEYAYRLRGCVTWVTEIWDLFAQLGLPRPKRFVDRYTSFGREELVRFATWDRDVNASRVFRPWRPFDHPQLGPVEIGGVDPRVGGNNPPPEELPGHVARLSALWLKTMALLPRVRLAVEVVPDGVRVEVSNLGYLPTNVLASAVGLPHNVPLWLLLEADGCTLGSPPRIEIGHLEGWGRGRGEGGGTSYQARSRGSGNRRVVPIAVRGPGQLRVTVGSCRVGWSTEVVDLA